jgi:nucleoside-diphosphate-sugar epimerase
VTILVTGGAGFVGLNVVETLLARGEDVVLFDTCSLPPRAARALESSGGTHLSVEQGSILDAGGLAAVFRKHRIDRVIHAAAVTSGPAREARDPGRIVEVNLNGTVNVLQAARQHGVKRTVYVGSGAAYGESLYRLPWLYEDTPSKPTTLYSVTKHAAERICMRLRELWEMDIVGVRLGTVIGPWERDTGARDNFGTHSQLAAMALAGETAVLPEREVQRDWVYTKDVAHALIALAHAPALRSTLYNVSSGCAWSNPIAQWCEALRRAFPRFQYRTAQANETANIWFTDRDRGLMDIGRLARDLDFRPKFLMGEAYSDFIDWLARGSSA